MSVVGDDCRTGSQTVAFSFTRTVVLDLAVSVMAKLPAETKGVSARHIGTMASQGISILLVHGELRMLGIDVSESTVAKYMIRHRKPPSQSWRTFLDNHVAEFASIDFFTVPTATFQILYVLVILRHDRREIVHFNIAQNPTAQWTAQQIVEAFPFDPPPRYLLSDRDCITHLSLGKQCPQSRAVQSPEKGKVIAFPHVGGLHHEYRRAA